MVNSINSFDSSFKPAGMGFSVTRQPSRSRNLDPDLSGGEGPSARHTSATNHRGTTASADIPAHYYQSIALASQNTNNGRNPRVAPPRQTVQGQQAYPAGSNQGSGNPSLASPTNPNGGANQGTSGNMPPNPWIVNPNASGTIGPGVNQNPSTQPPPVQIQPAPQPPPPGLNNSVGNAGKAIGGAVGQVGNAATQAFTSISTNLGTFMDDVSQTPYAGTALANGAVDGLWTAAKPVTSVVEDLANGKFKSAIAKGATFGALGWVGMKFIKRLPKTFAGLALIGTIYTGARALGGMGKMVDAVKAHDSVALQDATKEATTYTALSIPIGIGTKHIWKNKAEKGWAEPWFK